MSAKNVSGRQFAGYPFLSRIHDLGRGHGGSDLFDVVRFNRITKNDAHVMFDPAEETVRQEIPFQQRKSILTDGRSHCYESGPQNKRGMSHSTRSTGSAWETHELPSLPARTVPLQFSSRSFRVESDSDKRPTSGVHGDWSAQRPVGDGRIIFHA